MKIHDIIASTDPAYTPVYVLEHKTFHPEKYQAIRREISKVFFTQTEVVEEYWNLLGKPLNNFTQATLFIKKRDLRFGEGDYSE